MTPVMTVRRCCRDCVDWPEPVAITSNGLPPPESKFDFCELAVCVGAVVEESAGRLQMNDDCTVVDVVGAGCVRMLVSVLAAFVTGALLAVLELASSEDCNGSSCALVAFVDVVDVDVFVELKSPMVVTLTPGHRMEIPWPCRKTPIMLVSLTSSLEQDVLTACEISTSPCTQLALQRFF